MSQLHPDTDGSRRLRILFVTPRAYPEMGGIETHVYEVSRRLANQAESITILATDRSGELEQESFVDGVRILRIPAYPRKRDYYIAPSLHKHIQANQYDIIHIQGFHTFVPILAMRAALKANIPYVNTFHSGGHSLGWRNKIRPFQARLQRSLLSRSKCLIGVSQFEANQFREWLNLPESQFKVVNNGASLPPMPEDFEAPDTNIKMILSVGRLEKYKGHHRLIEAMPLILQQNSDVHLKILGVGPYKEELIKLAQELQVADHVEVTHIPPGQRSDMTREMLSASLITLFSEYEAHPVAVMEAAALQCSILVADTSGLSELAEKGLARAIPISSTSQEIAIAVLQQLEQPHQAPKTALPTWDSCTNELLEIYYEVLSR